MREMIAKLVKEIPLPINILGDDGNDKVPQKRLRHDANHGGVRLNKNPGALRPRDPLLLKEKCSKGDSNTHGLPH